MADVVGVDHIWIGTDTKMTPPYRPVSSLSPKPEQGNPNNRKDEPSRYNNDKKDLGGDKNSGRIGERTNEAWKNQNVSFYYAVVDAMLQTGFTEDEIGEIGGANFCRIFDAAILGR